MLDGDFFFFGGGGGGLDTVMVVSMILYQSCLIERAASLISYAASPHAGWLWSC